MTPGDDGSAPAGRRRHRGTAWLAVVGVLALVAVVVIAPALTHDFRIDLDHPKPAAELVGPYIAIAGRTTRAAHVSLFIDSTRIASVSTDSEHRFRFDDVLVGSDSLVVLKARTGGWLFGARSSRVVVTPTPVGAENARFISGPLKVNQPKARLTGLAGPFMAVVVSSPDTPDVTVQTNEHGFFQAGIELPKPGHYRFTVKAVSSPAGARAATRPTVVEFDPSWVPRFPDPVARRVTIIAERATGGIEVDVSLDGSDERARRLLTGDLPLPGFVHTVFGHVGFDLFPGVPLPLHLAFIGVTRPKITVIDSRVVVHARTDPRLTQALLPAWEGALTIRLGSSFDLSGRGDVVEVRSGDFDVRAMIPPPAAYDKGVARWDGKVGAAIDSIGVKLRSKPLDSREGVVGILHMPLDALVPWHVRPSLNVIAMMAPVAAVLALALVLGHTAPTDTDAAPRALARTAQHLLVLALVSPLLRVPSSLWALLDGMLPKQVAQLPGWLDKHHTVVIAGATLLVTLVLWLVVRARARRGAGHTARSLFAVASIAAAIAFVIDALQEIVPWDPQGFRMELIAPVILAPVVAWIVTRPFAVQQRRPRPVVWLVVILAAACLTYPLERGVEILAPEPRAYVLHFLSIAQRLVLCVLAWIVVARLRDAGIDDDAVRGRLAVLIFATYLVGVTTLALWLPVPFLLGLWLAPRAVLVTPLRRRLLDMLAPLIGREREAIAARSLALAEAQQFRDALDKVDRKTVSPAEFEKRKAEVEAYVAEHQRRTALGGGITAQEVVLGVGPHESHWRNAVVAIRHGAILALPLLVMYGVGLLSEDAWSNDPFYVLSAVVHLVAFATEWLMAAFFFGYFFSWIRGASGLTKGVRVALAVIICLLPARLANLGSLDGLLWLVVTAGQTFGFFAILGVWAFDYKTSRALTGGRFQWRTFARLGDMRTIATSASILVTAVGLAATSVLTNQFTTVLSLLVRMAFPQVDLPKPPTGPGAGP